MARRDRRSGKERDTKGDGEKERSNHRTRRQTQRRTDWQTYKLAGQTGRGIN